MWIWMSYRGTYLGSLRVVKKAHGHSQMHLPEKEKVVQREVLLNYSYWNECIL